MRRLALTTAAAAAIALAGTSGAGSAPAAKRAFVVHSTLDGKTVLASQQHWTVVPHTANTTVREVDFLIDGKLRWVEQQAPFTYGGDDGHGHFGFLYTSWLAPGKHSFTARVKTSKDGPGTDTVVARVPAAAPPAAQLNGTWTRTVTQRRYGEGDVRLASPGLAGGSS
jgi:hypothetical protein